MKEKNDDFTSVLFPKGFLQDEGKPSEYAIKLKLKKSITIRYVGKLPTRFRNVDRTRSGFHYGVIIKKGGASPNWAGKSFLLEAEDKTFKIGDYAECDTNHINGIRHLGVIEQISDKTVTMSSYLNEPKNRRISHYVFCSMNYTFDFKRYSRNHDDNHGADPRLI